MSAQTFVLEQWSKRFFVVIAVLLVGLVAGLLAINLPRAESLSSAVAVENQSSILRGIDASTARYTALAAHYAAPNDALQRGIDASSARYTALAAHLTAPNAGLQRGIDASSARYTAMAEYYAAQGK